MANIGRLDLNLFVVFDAIYAEGSITRASEILNLTQPAVSRALARLRDVVKDPLFVRERHEMKPTPLARELIGPIRGALHGIRNAMHDLDRFEPQTSRKRFKIGLRHTIESATFPALIQRMMAQAPSIEISSIQHDRDGLQTALTSGELDVAIDVQLARSSNISFKRLFGGGLAVIARRGHPRAAGAIDLETYLDCDHILATSGAALTGLEDRALEKLGHQRRVRVRCQHYWTASQLVAGSDMLLTMPQRFVRAFNQPLGNQILALPFAAPQAHLHVYWHAAMERDPANRWLREQIIDHFAESVGPDKYQPA
jgi:DNA-binding transcriptional LysR family regulator